MRVSTYRLIHTPWNNPWLVLSFCWLTTEDGFYRGVRWSSMEHQGKLWLTLLSVGGNHQLHLQLMQMFWFGLFSITGCYTISTFGTYVLKWSISYLIRDGKIWKQYEYLIETEILLNCVPWTCNYAAKVSLVRTRRSIISNITSS